MRRTAILALGALLALTSTVPAQVFIRVPFVTVQAGPGGAYVRTPFVTVDAGGRMLPPSTVIVQPAPLPAPSPIVIAPKQLETVPPPALVKVPTLAEFATSFVARAGTHEVTVIHPVTGRPVTVSFTLPDGTPKKIDVKRREIDFDYGRSSVTIRFMAGGKVSVRS